MKLVIQRVSEAFVEVEGRRVGEIQKGYLLYLAIHREDSIEDREWVLSRLLKAKLFEDSTGKLGLDINEVQGEVLLVSQFTLYGTLHKGSKPSFSLSAPREFARKEYELLVKLLNTRLAKDIQQGIFAANMKVYSVNEGPITLILDSKNPKGR